MNPRDAALQDPAALQLGGFHYTDVMRLLDTQLAPASYLEIGTREGRSLAAVSCDAIGIDPQLAVLGSAIGRKRRLHLFQMTSDEFFRDHDVRRYFPAGVDLTFIDGMHHVEFSLRDFINAESASHRRSVILLHDCLPSNVRMAQRRFVRGGAEEGAGADSWTGDVWKLVPILRQVRPDLRIVAFDAPPTGLIAVTNLDAQSTVLSRQYYGIVDAFVPLSIEAYGLQRLWGETPLTSTRALVAHPEQLTALLSFR